MLICVCTLYVCVYVCGCVHVCILGTAECYEEEVYIKQWKVSGVATSTESSKKFSPEWWPWGNRSQYSEGTCHGIRKKVETNSVGIGPCLASGPALGVGDTRVLMTQSFPWRGPAAGGETEVVKQTRRTLECPASPRISKLLNGSVLRLLFCDWGSCWCLLSGCTDAFSWHMVSAHPVCALPSEKLRYKSPGIPSQGVRMLKLRWINPIHSNSFLSTVVWKLCNAFRITAMGLNTNGWYSKRTAWPARKIPSHFKLRAEAHFSRTKQVCISPGSGDSEMTHPCQDFAFATSLHPTCSIVAGRETWFPISDFSISTWLFPHPPGPRPGSAPFHCLLPPLILATVFCARNFISAPFSSFCYLFSGFRSKENVQSLSAFTEVWAGGNSPRALRSFVPILPNVPSLFCWWQDKYSHTTSLFPF